MFVIGVDDVAAWYQRIGEMIASNAFPGVRAKAPERVEESLVLHVWDPSGVLLVFVQ